MRTRTLWMVVLALVSGIAVSTNAWAEEDEAPDAPPADAPAPEPPPAPDDLEESPGLDVVAPRVFGGTRETDPALSETALRRIASTFEIPNAVTVIDQEDLRRRRAARSLSGALEGTPGVLVQKTGPLQHSPFIRGFTGYQNLLLIDGVRLNHSAMRSGPNQYWATVDSLSIARLESTRGPHSVLYGSDAVGGTVNAIPWRRDCYACGIWWGGGFYTRYASAEDAVFTRAELEGNHNSVGWATGASYKRYGDIESGAGTQPETGDIDEWDIDMRVDWRINSWWTLTFAGQNVRQIDAPRTERTIFSVPFAGTSVGTELKRDFDQERTLAYARLRFDGGPCCRPFSTGQITVSYHRHQEERDRLRTMNRRDLSGFDLHQYGVALQLTSPTSIGRLTYGFDYYRDEVDSFRDDFVAGVLTLSQVQGPLGDDGTYDLFGAYIQDEISLGRLTLFAGVRFTYAAADADRVDNPAVAGNDPATPGNIIGVSNDWTNVVGSLRGVYCINSCWNLYGGVSQAFRAPSLHDLTSLDSTSVVETPSPNLDPEEYLSFELGVKTEQRRLRASAAAWYTRLNDTIIRSPTGNLIMGVPEVRKDNIGDGWVWGIEVDVAYQVHPCVLAFGNLSWMDGEVDQLDTNGNLVREPVTRLKPLGTLLGVRYAPPRSRFWVQAEWLHSEKADKLSLRDRTDSRRIPPGGTPGWDVVNLRAGLQVNRRAHVSLGLENLFDENYRVHGSGQNEPGFQAVLALDVDF
ncbi:MAG: TonB-dependent receptor [Planctomycetota bacterium]|nr:TonB-dependent receptor [Planctomycetota bacterium]